MSDTDQVGFYNPPLSTGDEFLNWMCELYAMTGDEPPTKHQWGKITERLTEVQAARVRARMLELDKKSEVQRMMATYQLQQAAAAARVYQTGVSGIVGNPSLGAGQVVVMDEADTQPWLKSTLDRYKTAIFGK